MPAKKRSESPPPLEHYNQACPGVVLALAEQDPRLPRLRACMKSLTIDLPLESEVTKELMLLTEVEASLLSFAQAAEVRDFACEILQMNALRNNRERFRGEDPRPCSLHLLPPQFADELERQWWGVGSGQNGRSAHATMRAGLPTPPSSHSRTPSPPEPNGGRSIFNDKGASPTPAQPAPLPVSFVPSTPPEKAVRDRLDEELATEFMRLFGSADAKEVEQMIQAIDLNISDPGFSAPIQPEQVVDDQTGTQLHAQAQPINSLGAQPVPQGHEFGQQHFVNQFGPNLSAPMPGTSTFFPKYDSNFVAAPVDQAQPQQPYLPNGADLPIQPTFQPTPQPTAQDPSIFNRSHHGYAQESVASIQQCLPTEVPCVSESPAAQTPQLSIGGNINFADLPNVQQQLQVPQPFGFNNPPSVGEHTVFPSGPTGCNLELGVGDQGSGPDYSTAGNDGYSYHSPCFSNFPQGVCI